MKNTFKIFTSILALILVAFGFHNEIAAAAPSLNHLSDMVPHWVNHSTALSAGVMIPTRTNSPTVDQSLAVRGGAAPQVQNNAAYGTSGQTVDPTIHVIVDDATLLNFSVNYTIGGTYVALTDIPLLPWKYTDRMPTGITFASSQFASDQEWEEYFTISKLALASKIQFDASVVGLLSSGKIRTRAYNDANTVMNDNVLPFSIAAPNWINPFITTTQYIANAKWLTGDANNRYTIQLPATSGAIMAVTTFVPDAKGGAIIGKSRQ